MSSAATKRIAAGVVFFDAWDILPLAISNLVVQGVRDFYLMDHASSEDRGQELVALFDDVANVRISRKESRPFVQDRIMSALAEIARQDGFDVFIPFDSDEFWDTSTADETVADVLANWAASGHGDALRVPEIDYIQSELVNEFASTHLASARMRAEWSSWPAAEARLEIEAGAPYFIRAPSSKVAVRLQRTPGRISPIDIAAGSHNLLSGSVVHDSRRLVIRHLPFRSRMATYRRVQHGYRHKAAGHCRDIGWQNQHLAELSPDELSAFWSRNSWNLDKGHPTLRITNGTTANIVDDDTLERLLQACIDLDLPLQLNPERKRGASSSLRPAATLTSRLLDLLLDDTRFVDAVRERDRAVQERDRAVQERDRAVQERDAVIGSAIWRASRPYRAFRTLLRGNVQEVRREAPIPAEAPGTEQPRLFSALLRHKLAADRREIVATISDKVLARDIVAEIVGPMVLTNVFQVSECSKSLRWGEFPREYVAKVSHGSGGVIVVTSSASPDAKVPDPSLENAWGRFWIHPDSADQQRIGKLLDYWTTLNYAMPWSRRPWFEWCYRDHSPRILVEELLTDDPDGPPIEFQYQCYVIGGKVRFIRVHWNRVPNRPSITLKPDWTVIPLTRFLGSPGANNDQLPDRPAHLPQIIATAETLGAIAVDFVRVDLYDTPRGVIFGELTNYPFGGQGEILPASYDAEWGSFWPSIEPLDARYTLSSPPALAPHFGVP